MNIYNFEMKDHKGTMVSLKDYEGKVLLVVNTATQCGLTPQYTALQELYDYYANQGFEILDFPCNQFKEQAPESDAQIHEFCSLTYGTKFPRFAKIKVNGEDAAPLYKWLKEEKPVGKGDSDTEAFNKRVSQFTPDNKEEDIKWNFEKFLIDRTGMVIQRYAPSFPVENIGKDIQTLL